MAVSLYSNTDGVTDSSDRAAGERRNSEGDCPESIAPVAQSNLDGVCPQSCSELQHFDSVVYDRRDSHLD
jgi:hypothetical protein